MTQSASATKGESLELKISKDAKQRLVVGLAWDPRPATKGETFQAKTISHATSSVGYIFWPIAKILGLFGVKTGETSKLSPDYIHNISRRDKADDAKDKREDNYKEFDLDLSCFVYDKNGIFITSVGPAFDQCSDPTSKIYHSGEEQIGDGGPDDEQVHIETKDIPEEYCNLFFVVVSDCHFKLGDTNKPAIRLADSKTEQNFLTSSIDPPANENSYGYVFARIYKQDNKWFARSIHEFADPHNDWEVYLRRFL